MPHSQVPGQEGHDGYRDPASFGHPCYRAGSIRAGGTGILLNPLPSPEELWGGGWRAILDLKKLNIHLVYKHFKMQSLQSILGCICQGDLLTSMDIKEAYLYVLIRPSHRWFQRFYFAGHHYQYRILPFGLSSAPRTFTKMLAAVAAYLRPLPVRLQCYLDDILI